MSVFFFFQAEDGIRDVAVTGVQTCALPIYQADEDRRDQLFQSQRPEQRAIFFHPCRRSEEHTSELQSRLHLVCRLLLEKKKTKYQPLFFRLTSRASMFSMTRMCCCDMSRQL